METKICRLCKKKLDKKLFYKRKESTDGLLSYCKKCVNAVAKARYASNPEKIKARSRAWDKDHPEKANARIKAWAKAHPEVTRANCQIRRSKKAALPSTLTPEQWNHILDAFNNACAYCGCGDKKLHQDHLIALSKGGGYDATNIIPSCKSCNSSKGAKDFFTWYSTFKYYSKAKEENILNFLLLLKEQKESGSCGGQGFEKENTTSTFNIYLQ